MYLGRVVETGPVEAIYAPPAPSLYTRVVRLEADARSRSAHHGNAAHRRSAQPDQSAFRLPLPHPLRLRRGNLRGTGAAARGAAGWRRRQRLRISSPAICRMHSRCCMPDIMPAEAAGVAGRRPDRALPPPRHRCGRGERRVVLAGARRDADHPRRIRLRQERQPEGADGPAAGLRADRAATSGWTARRCSSCRRRSSRSCAAVRSR